eukprot:m.57709 g.57709  ORF g.57709 m.57709 type:complete len:413 (+) comp6849_c0_seq1:1217-2455(+)
MSAAAMAAARHGLTIGAMPGLISGEVTIDGMPGLISVEAKCALLTAATAVQSPGTIAAPSTSGDLSLASMTGASMTGDTMHARWRSDHAMIGVPRHPSRAASTTRIVGETSVRPARRSVGATLMPAAVTRVIGATIAATPRHRRATAATIGAMLPRPRRAIVAMTTGSPTVLLTGSPIVLLTGPPTTAARIVMVTLAMPDAPTTGKTELTGMIVVRPRASTIVARRRGRLVLLSRRRATQVLDSSKSPASLASASQIPISTSQLPCSLPQHPSRCLTLPRSLTTQHLSLLRVLTASPLNICPFCLHPLRTSQHLSLQPPPSAPPLRTARPFHLSTSLPQAYADITPTPYFSTSPPQLHLRHLQHLSAHPPSFQPSIYPLPPRNTSPRLRPPRPRLLCHVCPAHRRPQGAPGL